LGWHNVVVNQSLMAGGPKEIMMEDGKDPTSYKGSVKMPYDLANLRVNWVRAESPAPRAVTAVSWPQPHGLRDRSLP
jgi:isoquinoline 1-oxidoreductase beta subunit